MRAVSRRSMKSRSGIRVSSITEGDALKADWLKLIGPEAGKAIIAANLPYGIATILLVNWLESEPWPPWWDRMVLMFQKRGRERIVAEPGSKAYGRLAGHRAVAHAKHASS